jgi:transcriptional regulator with XRE-family HTH domain
MKTNWLRNLREKQHINQEELASLLQLEGVDVTRATVSHWENERHHVPLADAKVRRALSRILQVSIAELLIAAGYEIGEPSLDEAARRAAYIVEQLPPEKRALAINILEQILKSNFAPTG